MIIRGKLSRVESSMKMTGTATDVLQLLQRSLIRNIKHWGYSTPGLCDELQSGELLPEALSFRMLILRKPVVRALHPIELDMLIGKSYRMVADVVGLKVAHQKS
jgi:hypothetical protein